MSGKNSLFISMMFAIWLLLTPFVVCAGTIAWSNAAGGAWETPANWLPAVVPVAGDNVTITGAGANPVVINSAPIINTVKVVNGKLAIASGRLVLT